ncbi:MAG: DNA helicase UvrD [Verrucomicrobia bacterium]|nr:MAG: DNA helicase UvrD [Verrucomicrobiota bacterium]
MIDLAGLNPQQREAVTTTEGPVLILAGAGTGKTRVITHRIAWLIAKGVPPGHILAVTFTNKAAREMLERVNQMVPRRRRRAGQAAPERPTICTFHSLCVRILRRHIHRLGYKPNFVIYDESEQLGVIKRLLSRLANPKDRPDPGAVLASLSRLRNAAGSRAAAEPDPLALRLLEEYRRALRACNAVDFDDLILLTLELFEKHPDALEECRRRHRYVMVDEYQDTNAAQFRLVHALTAEHRNLCVVGDDDQSIYGWRGAEIANLLDLEKYYPGLKVIKLEQNYRSTNRILKAANALIRNNPRRRPKNLWSAHGEGEPILLHVFDDEAQEAQAVVEHIETNRRIRRIPWSEQAVLFRTNIQSRPLEAALRKARVRYHLVGGQSFFDRREIRDLLAYLKLLLNPDDDISLLRIANVPARGLSDRTMERLLAASQERGQSVYQTMRSPVVQTEFPRRTGGAITRFVDLVERTRAELEALRAEPGGRKLSDWVLGFLQRIGYLEDLRRLEKDPEVAENRHRALVETIRSMDPLEREPAEPAPARLQRFLEEVSLDSDRDEDDRPRDAVTLITIHSCKGLEFGHVWIVGLEEGLLPHTRSKMEGSLDEERRLFYVAITRARKTLHLSWCRARRKYGQLQASHPSCFLKELPEDLVEPAEKQPPRLVEAGNAKALLAAFRQELNLPEET